MSTGAWSPVIDGNTPPDPGPDRGATDRSKGGEGGGRGAGDTGGGQGIHKGVVETRGKEGRGGTTPLKLGLTVKLQPLLFGTVRPSVFFNCP